MQLLAGRKWAWHKADIDLSDGLTLENVYIYNPMGAIDVPDINLIFDETIEDKDGNMHIHKLQLTVSHKQAYALVHFLTLALDADLPEEGESKYLTHDGKLD